jgi:trehalose 6-phosphate phosphatase
MSGKSLQKSLPAPSALEDIQEKLEPLASEPDRAAVLLDLDGTLAPIVPRPEDVSVPPPILKLIRMLSHSYLAVAIVSGRSANAAKRIVGNSELAYIGNHGFETMIPGHATVVCEEAQPYLAAMKQLAEKIPLEARTEAGVWLEDKTATISYHYRRAADAESALEFINSKVVPEAEKLGLVTSNGRMVVEVRPPVEINKGVSVGHLLDRLQTRRAVYIGDDTTDIDAFRELRKRRRRKDTVMVTIGVISREMPRELPRYCDLLVARTSGVETVLQILSGEES